MKTLFVTLSNGQIINFRPLLTTFLILTTYTLNAQIYTVNSTDDTNDCECDDTPCTLRDAICLANSDGAASEIHFDIKSCTTCTIKLIDVPLVLSEDTTIIDATTQPGNFPMDSRIIIDAANVAGNKVFDVQGYYSEFYGLHITRNLGTTSTADIGIYVNGNSTTIGAANKGNIIEKMHQEAIYITNSKNNIIIQHNALGTDFDKTLSTAPTDTGIFIDSGCQSIEITNNIIAHTSHFGIENKSNGVDISYNEICFNGDYGVYNVDPGQSSNLIKENSFYCNHTAGIKLSGGNGGILPPTISSATPNKIEGTSLSYSEVEVYISDDTGCIGDPCQGKTFLGRVFAGGSGNWTLNLPYTISDIVEVTATVTDGTNNTSEFAGCVTISSDECSGAAVLPMNTEACGHLSVSANLNIAATSTPGPNGSCSGTFVGNDVWFQVKVPVTGNLLIRQHASTTVNASIEAYTDCFATTPIQCQEIHELPNAMILEGMPACSTIYLRIWDQNNAIVASATPAIVELSAHILSTDKDLWELCDFPITQGVPNESEFGGGRKKANEFIIQYRPDATAADIASMEQQLTAMGAMLLDSCACTTPTLQLWGESNPIAMEQCKKAAAKSKSKVDTVNYNYVIEDISCEEIIVTPTNLSELFQAFQYNMLTISSGFLYEFEDTSGTSAVQGYYEYDFGLNWQGGSITGLLDGYYYTATIINIDNTVTPNTADLVGTVYDAVGNPIGTLMGNTTDYIAANNYTDISIQATITLYTKGDCAGQGTPFSFTSYSPSSPTKQVVVAVSDTGIDGNHLEFSNALWANPTPNVCVAGDVNGYDFFNDDGGVEDVDGHGTGVSGILVNSFPSDVKLDIMNLKFYENGAGTVFDGACTVYYAIENGAEILNLSWGFEANEFPEILHDAIEYANCNNVFIATSAGNRGKNNDLINKYPANFDFHNLVTVASYDDFAGNAQRSEFSNYGKNTVDIAAPGYAESVKSGGGTELLAGTSISAPFVAQAAAILRADFPSFTTADIKECILSSATYTGTLVDTVATAGILDFTAAYNCAAAKYFNSINCSALLLNYSVVHEICSGENGEIDLLINSGMPPYTIEWSNEETTEDLSDLAAGCYQVVVTDAQGCTGTLTIQVDNQCGLRVAPKVILQGPYDLGIGMMKTDLKTSGLIPYYEPYGTGKGEFFNVYTTPTFPNETVDWVLVELRDKINPSTIISTRAALLQRDGDVVDTDGVSAVLFGDVPADDYYVVVRHRNHLGVMSNSTYYLTR